eukprot:UN32728
MIIRFYVLIMLCYSLGQLRRAFAFNYETKLLEPFIALITVSQFHTLFYGSRMLANTFAMFFVNMAFCSYLIKRYKNVIYYLAAGTIIFRCDIVLLAIPILTCILVKDLSRLKEYIIYGIKISLIFIMIATILDSIFWGRLCWAEFDVFKFNVIENRSSEWGTKPWWFYFIIALPRAMIFTLFLIGPGLLKTHPIAAVSLAWQTKRPMLVLDYDATEITLIIFTY